MTKTSDKTVSPKVYVPLAVNILIGAFLVLVGERQIGVTVLLAAVVAGGVGYATPPRR